MTHEERKRMAEIGERLDGLLVAFHERYRVPLVATLCINDEEPELIFEVGVAHKEEPPKTVEQQTGELLLEIIGRVEALANLRGAPVYLVLLSGDEPLYQLTLADTPEGAARVQSVRALAEAARVRTDGWPLGLGPLAGRPTRARPIGEIRATVRELIRAAAAARDPLVAIDGLAYVVAESGWALDDARREILRALAALGRLAEAELGEADAGEGTPGDRE